LLWTLDLRNVIAAAQIMGSSSMQTYVNGVPIEIHAEGMDLCDQHTLFRVDVRLCRTHIAT
jgi:hypothetical protein